MPLLKELADFLFVVHPCHGPVASSTRVSPWLNDAVAGSQCAIPSQVRSSFRAGIREDLERGTSARVRGYRIVFAFKIANFADG